MRNSAIRISDARSAANVYAVATHFGLSTTLPANAAELAQQTRRVFGRGRDLVQALNAFVEAKGFDALADAVRTNVAKRGSIAASGSPAEAQASDALATNENSKRLDTEAASTPSAPSFDVASELADPIFALMESGSY